MVANIKEAYRKKEAIKFNAIELFFRVDQQLKAELYSKLKGFSLAAKKLGPSYYKFCNKTYEMVYQDIDLYYEFTDSSENRPVYLSNDYKQVENIQPSLSPYGIWEFHLINVADQHNFNELRKFINQTDLELVISKGSYLSFGDKNACKSIDLSDYKNYLIED